SCLFFFSSRRRHTRCYRDWSSDVCSSDLSRARRPAARDALLYCFFSSPRYTRQPHLQAGWVTCRSGGLGSRANTCSLAHSVQQRSEERRVGKESRLRVAGGSGTETRAAPG